MRKKLISVITALLLFVTSTQVYAIGNISDASKEIGCDALEFSINEYDMLMEERQQTEEILSTMGYTQAEILDSKTNTIEQMMYQRAQLSEEELSSEFGYSAAQIAILKEYDGRDLANYPQMRAVAATMSGRITSPQHSTQYITAKLDWEWSTPPAFFAYEDVIGVRWQGINSSAQNLSLSMQTLNSYAKISYYDTAEGTDLEYTEWPDFSNVSPYEHAEISFERLSLSLIGYAKSGTVNICVGIPSTATASIAEASFIFAYGMVNNSNSYSISFPASFSITFGTNTTQALYKAVVITANGTIRNY